MNELFIDVLNKIPPSVFAMRPPIEVDAIDYFQGAVLGIPLLVFEYVQQVQSFVLMILLAIGCLVLIPLLVYLVGKIKYTSIVGIKQSCQTILKYQFYAFVPLTVLYGVLVWLDSGLYFGLIVFSSVVSVLLLSTVFVFVLLIRWVWELTRKRPARWYLYTALILHFYIILIMALLMPVTMNGSYWKLFGEESENWMSIPTIPSQ